MLSADALLALALVIGLATFGKMMLYETTSNDTLMKMQSMQRTDDVFTTMINTGYMLDTIDTNGFNSGAVQAIYARMDEMMPVSTDFRIVMRRYDVNFTQCRDAKTFEACFPDENMAEMGAGNMPPEDREVIHGRKVFVKKEQPGECEIDYNSEYAHGGNADAFWNGILLFASAGGADVNFSVDVVPEDELECGEEADVTLGMAVGVAGRDPVDVSLVMDRSGSMGDFTMWDRNVAGGTFDSGTKQGNQYYNWQNIGTFAVDSNQAFAAVLKYSGYSGGGGANSPKLKLTSPSDTNYGGNSATVTINYPAQLGTWTAWGWSSQWIDYNVGIYYKKIDVSKDGAQYFVALADWEQQDQLALVSYSTSPTLDQALTTDKGLVWQAIEELNANGTTATGDAIYMATDELMNGTNQNPDAMKFQVLLSDGQTNTGSSSSAAAQDAKNKGIIIYTIGLGEDVDANELQNIANITGGQYYYANDQNALQELYEIIAGQIGDDASQGTAMENVVVTLPVPEGTVITDEGNGNFQQQEDGNFLVFTVGNMGYNSEWQGNYSLVYPCSNQASCSSSERVFPEDGSIVGYIDANGNSQTINWDANKILDFLYRDLAIEIMGGKITGENEMYIDVNAKNTGFLESGATDVKFYLGNTGDNGGEFLTSRDVNTMCGGLDSYCETGSSQEIYDVFINKEGYIYAAINDGNDVEECPNGNVDSIKCYGGAKTQYFTLDYWTWLD